MRTRSTTGSHEEEIRAVIEDWTAALRAKNPHGVVRHQAPRFVLFSLAPPLVSAETDTSGLEAWFDTWEGPLGYELRDLEITAGDDTAFCHGLAQLTGTKVGGQRSDIWFRQTLCLRKVGERWTIAHQHESVPFYMDGSLRAAVDLKP